MLLTSFNCGAFIYCFILKQTLYFFVIQAIKLVLLNVNGYFFSFLDQLY